MPKDDGKPPGKEGGKPLSDVFQEGADARAGGVTQADNPYDIDTPSHAEWSAGWCATFDLDEENDPASDREKAADEIGETGNASCADPSIPTPLRRG